MTDAVAYRFGILGAGRVARGFATGLSSVRGAELAAVVSRSHPSASSFGATFPGITVHTGYEALVADDSVDVVYVATPHHLHAEQSKLVLEAGKALLCEKPFTLDAGQARAVADLARARGLFCMEAMWMRFFPAIQRAKEMVEDGVIGEPRLLLADFGVPTVADPGSRFFDPDQGGGALLDRGVYAVSLATMLFGRPQQVRAMTNLTQTGVDEHAGIILGFGGGVLAVLSAALTSLSTNTAVLAGTEGSVTIEAPFFCSDRLTVRHHRAAGVESEPSRRDEVVARVQRTRPGRGLLRIVKPLLVARPTRLRFPIAGNGYGYEASEVVRCLRAGELESPRMPLDDSILVMEILDAIRSAWAI